MNTQELFNTVVTHLLTQKAKAQNASGGSCLYRAPNGMKCAVGCIIKDEFYRCDMEGGTPKSSHEMGHGMSERNRAKSKSINNAIGLSLGREVTDEELQLLSRLQSIHDSKDADEWPAALADLAQQKGLQFTPPA